MRFWRHILPGVNKVLFMAVLAAAVTLMSPSGSTAQDKIMIFGGPGHDTYLGCLSCSDYSTESVFNEFSQFGSSYSTNSIYNSFSRFGSQFSKFSACSRTASDPPVIVNQDGDYYGRLTINNSHPDQISSREILSWLRRVCGS